MFYDLNLAGFEVEFVQTLLMLLSSRPTFILSSLPIIKTYKGETHLPTVGIIFDIFKLKCYECYCPRFPSFFCVHKT